MPSSARQPRRRALRVAILVTGLSVPLGGCEQLVERVLHGRAMDGTPCVGWSIQGGSPLSCCGDLGGEYEQATGRCLIPRDYGMVEGPFVPPALHEG